VLAQHSSEPDDVSLAGLADLTLARRSGRTCLVRRQTRPPLVVQRALYLDEALPDMAFVYLCNPTAGVLQGDNLQVRVRLCPGARCHLTTQAATKVYATPQGSACQETCLHVSEGAWLEYLPDPVIPFSGSRFSQKTSITISPGATLIYGEIITQGRAALGESLAYTRLDSHLTVRRPDGLPIYHESFSLAPGSRSPIGRGILGIAGLTGSTGPRGLLGATVLGTLLVVAEGVDPNLFRAGLFGLLAEWGAVAAGVSLLPGGGGIGIKVLAQEVLPAQAVLHRAWAEARREILGVNVPSLRKY
jgi:urease accessory protein